VELLELWLDGELPEDQSEALRQRLSAEPALAQALDALRGERQIRARVWQALEPGDTDVESLVSSVRRSVMKEEVWASRLRTLRNVSGIAASIAIVFLAGWISRGRLSVGGEAPDNLTGILQASNATSAGRAALFGPPIDNSVGLVSTPSVMPVWVPPVRATGRFQVQVLDPAGNTIFVQQLDQLNDPTQFTEELGRRQGVQPQNLRNPTEPIFINTDRR
jgi:hypothetical protein